MMTPMWNLIINGALAVGLGGMIVIIWLEGKSKQLQEEWKLKGRLNQTIFSNSKDISTLRNTIENLETTIDELHSRASDMENKEDD